MTPDTLQAISHYGYWVIFAGALLEGETLLIAAGYAAHEGLLYGPWVVATAAVGGALGDQLAFLLGRSQGHALLSRFPWVARRIPGVHRMLEQHEAWAIIGVRFLYGLRIAGPIILGTSRIPWKHFVGLNILGAVLWALLVFAGGYFFSSLVTTLQPESYSGVRLLLSLVLVWILGRVLWTFSKK